jgi:hypothetical protein
MTRIPKRKVQVLDAAFDPEGKVICPECFSRPSVAGRRDYEASGKRGWGVRMEEDPLRIKREEFAVAITMYPCANADCLTHILVRSLLAFLGSKEAQAPFAAKRTLKGRKLSLYESGQTGKDGIWRRDGVPLVVAPEPPPPKVKKAAPKSPKKTTHRKVTTRKKPKK